MSAPTSRATTRTGQLVFQAALLLATNACFPCWGQGSSTSVQNNGINAVGEAHAKLVKTQGTNVGANVHCGLQDKAGNLWFGTTGEGVYRFDGKTFTQYTVKDGLPNNNVWCMVMDKAGIIWFGTGAGLCRYDGKRFMRIPFTVGTDKQPFALGLAASTAAAGNAVTSLLLDKSGKLWLGAADGVYCYDGATFTRLLDTPGIRNQDKLRLHTIQAMAEDKAGHIWFASWFEGLCRYDGHSITSFKPGGEVWFSALLVDRAGTLWVNRRYKGVYRYDGKAFAPVPQKGIFDVSTARPLLQDSQGALWFGSDLQGGGRVWRYATNAFQDFTGQDSLDNYGVWCMVEDHQGNLWVGTRNVGLYRYDGQRFTKFSE